MEKIEATQLSGRSSNFNLHCIGYRESSPSRPFSDVNNIHLRADDKMVSVAAKASLRKEMKVVLKGLSKEARWFVFPSHSSLGCFASRFNVVPSTACLLYLPFPVSCCQSRAVSKLGEMAIRYVFNQIPFYKIPENIFCIYSDDFSLPK